MDMIHEYIRERVAGKGKQKVGVMVGLVHDGVICTGFSKAKIKAGDAFDKDEGFRIAKERAMGLMASPALPPQIVRPMREMQMRCVKYFQQADLLSTKGAYIGRGRGIIDIPKGTGKSIEHILQFAGRENRKENKPKGRISLNELLMLEKEYLENGGMEELKNIFAEGSLDKDGFFGRGLRSWIGN